MNCRRNFFPLRVTLLRSTLTRLKIIERAIVVCAWIFGQTAPIFFTSALTHLKTAIFCVQSHAFARCGCCYSYFTILSNGKVECVAYLILSVGKLFKLLIVVREVSIFVSEVSILNFFSLRLPACTPPSETQIKLDLSSIRCNLNNKNQL